jgi:CRISPR/Cas system-associated protein Cas10 (large subunit of type III CRISPR-Cas system)
MAKPHRGSSLRELFKHGRGECPVCKRKNVKILYEQEKDGQKFKICKTCKAAVKNGKKSLPAVAKAPSEEEKPAEAAG